MAPSSSLYSFSFRQGLEGIAGAGSHRSQKHWNMIPNKSVFQEKKEFSVRNTEVWEFDVHIVYYGKVCSSSFWHSRRLTNSLPTASATSVGREATWIRPVIEAETIWWFLLLVPKKNCHEDKWATMRQFFSLSPLFAYRYVAVFPLRFNGPRLMNCATIYGYNCRVVIKVAKTWSCVTVPFHDW